MIFNVFCKNVKGIFDLRLIQVRHTLGVVQVGLLDVDVQSVSLIAKLMRLVIVLVELQQDGIRLIGQVDAVIMETYFGAGVIVRG
jgi:hypothetical protein